MDAKDIQYIFPVTPAQDGLLQKEEKSDDNRLIAICELSGNLNLSAFEAAWQNTAVRHQILRTIFAWKRLDKPLQIILKRFYIGIEKHDLRHLPDSDRQMHLDELISSQYSLSLDPAAGNLMRPVLAQIADQQFLLILICHGLILDVVSIKLILREILSDYESLAKSESSNQIHEDALRDYFGWMKQQDLSEAEAQWKSILKDSPAPTSLFPESLHVEKALQFSVPQKAQTVITESRTSELKVFLQTHGIDSKALLLGAWAALLNRYVGENDVVFGVKVSGRPSDVKGIDSIAGPLAAILPWRSRISRETARLDWLKAVEKAREELSRFDHVCAHQIQQWCDLPDEKLRFESVVSLEPVEELSSLTSGDLKLESVSVCDNASPPLIIEMISGSAFTLRATYDNGRYDQALIEYLLNSLRNIIDEIVSQPDHTLVSLQLLDQATAHRMLFEWNDTGTEDSDYLVHDLFEAQAKQTPDAVAAVFADQHITYGELNRRANRLANYLSNLGVGPEILVGICIDRSFDMLTSILGVMKAGGAYLPLDSSYPIERLAYILDEAQPPVILSQERLVERLPMSWAQVVYLDSQWEEIAFESCECPQTAVSSDNLVYVIYTSGSTGKPKGVCVNHRGLANLAQAQLRTLGVMPDSQVLQFASISFDASIFEIVMALAKGATICLGDQESMLPGPAFIKLLRDRQVTVATLPPSVLAVLPEGEVPTIETVIAAGEACSSAIISRWASGRKFFNAYGPTETTVWATLAECYANNIKPDIGHPITNVQTYLFDAHFNPVPISARGELCIGGIGLARGYFNRPDLTAEQFTPHPFSKKAGSRLYRTGDVARYKADGRIDFLGRVDHQVKLRGFRIETGEIESFLRQYPNVKDALVIVREGLSGHPRLIAYLVLDSNDAEGDSITGTIGENEFAKPAEVSPASLKNHLARFLPEYMLPANFVILDAFPLTSSGKIDRQALPTPNAGDSPDKFVAPRTDTEKLLASIWLEILGVERVSIHDNFFEMGGHSLLATQALSRIRDLFQVELPLRTLFESPFIESLAERLDTILWARNLEAVTVGETGEMEEGLL